MTSAADLDDLPDDAAEVLHSFAVHARFRRAAGSAEQADVQVREELAPARPLWDDTRVEPQDPDGSWPVDVRFVVASVDGESAVNGVHATLREFGITPDEAWVAEQLP